MKTDSRDIDKQQLKQIISTRYELNITSITFVPKGEDAYSYIAVGPDGTRHLIRAQSVSRATGLERVYETLATLHSDHGLGSVVAPHATPRGTFTTQHAGYTVAVFPFIEGNTLFDQGATDVDLTRAATIIAALHECSAVNATLSLRRETFDNPFKTPILRALQATDDDPFGANDCQHRLTRLFAAERDDILATLEKMKQLGVAAKTLTTDWVLTHGDPNLDNILKDQEGRLHLIDWGDVAIGPPERDLFAFTGEGFATFLSTYASRRTRVKLHCDIFAFYFFRWAVQEIADYATRILFGNMGRWADEHAWAELQPYLPIPHGSIARGLRALQTTLDQVLGFEEKQ